MKELSIEELKNVELELLLKTDKICKDNNIRYFLGFGTLLGAVRHQGFIPWDDDVDLIMDRENFDKFTSIFDSGGGYEQISDIRYLTFSLDRKSPYAFGKVCDARTKCEFEGITPVDNLGVYIDVFPLDTIPDKDMSMHFKFMSRLNDIRVMSMSVEYTKASHHNRDFIKRTLYFLSKNMGTKFWVSAIDRQAKKYNNLSSEFCANNTMSPKKYRKDWFENTIDVSFEGHVFPAPNGWHEYLTTQYGDYMVLPPIDQQVGHHDFVAYL